MNLSPDHSKERIEALAKMDGVQGYMFDHILHSPNNIQKDFYKACCKFVCNNCDAVFVFNIDKSRTMTTHDYSDCPTCQRGNVLRPIYDRKYTYIIPLEHQHRKILKSLGYENIQTQVRGFGCYVVIVIPFGDSVDFEAPTIEQAMDKALEWALSQEKKS